MWSSVGDVTPPPTRNTCLSSLFGGIDGGDDWAQATSGQRSRSVRGNSLPTALMRVQRGNAIQRQNIVRAIVEHSNMCFIGVTGISIPSVHDLSTKLKPFAGARGRGGRANGRLKPGRTA